MSIRYAILVSLSRKESTGYEIANEFDRGLGFFWKSSHQQIYKELGKLAGDGLVSYKQVHQKDKPSKKVYQLTGDGKQDLIEWLGSQTELPPIKDPLLIKLFAGYLVSPNKLLQELNRHQKMTEEKLQQYRGIEEEYFSSPEQLPIASQYMYLTLLRGITARQSWLDWAKQTQEFLQKQIDQQS